MPSRAALVRPVVLALALLGLAAAEAHASYTASVSGGVLRVDTVSVTAPNGTRVQVAGLHTVTRIMGGEAVDDLLHVRTLAGDDTVGIASSVRSLIGVNVDLGVDG